MIIVVKWLIVLYLGLLPLSAWVYRKQLPNWLLVFICLPSSAQFIGLADRFGIYFRFIFGLRCTGFRWSHSFWEKSTQSLFISCCTEFHFRSCPVFVLKITSPHKPSALG